MQTLAPEHQGAEPRRTEETGNRRIEAIEAASEGPEGRHDHTRAIRHEARGGDATRTRGDAGLGMEMAADLAGRGRELGQDVDDTLKQAAGKDPIPPPGQPLPPISPSTNPFPKYH